jgi:diguanylate cyclase (GGDEF)-like protein/PAS domain S-box-containing protein
MKILVAGTCPETLTLLGRAIASLGDEACFCEDAASTQEHCRSHLFPLIILDQVLPDRDGFELSDQIRSDLRGTVSFILVAAAVSPADCLDLLEAGPDDILFHPLDLDTVRLRLVMAKKRVEEQRREKQRIRTTQALVTALETMQLGVTITDTEGKILYTNPGDAAMHGYETGELIGRDARLFSPSCHRNCLTVEQMKPLRSWKRESVNVRKDGTLFPVQLLSDVVRDGEDGVIGIVTTCEDITERKSAEELRRKSEQLFHDTAEAATVLMWMITADSLENFLDQRWLNSTGRKVADQVGAWSANMQPDDLQQCRQVCCAAFEKRENFRVEYRLKDRQGAYRWILDHGAPWFLADGRFAGYIGSCLDITDRKQAEAQLQHDASHDPLTGLPNCALFQARLAAAVDQTRGAEGYLFAVLFLDVDGFKLTNDNHGHLVGDRLLVAVAERIQAALRPGDTVGRIGGDEFAILLDDLKEENDAILVAERILDEFSTPLRVEGREMRTSISIGISFNRREMRTIEDLMRGADRAMYRAKAMGKARYVIFGGNPGLSHLSRQAMNRPVRKPV